MASLYRLLIEEKGQGMVEYALIIGLVGILLVGALAVLKNGLLLSLGNSANQIP